MSYKCEKCGNMEITDGFVVMELGRCQKAYNELQEKIDSEFWEGFDAAIEMVLNTIDNSHIHTLPIMLRDEILDEVELYKKDG